MSPKLLQGLARFLDGTMSRRELARLVDSFDVWNRWQDDDPEIQALRPIIDDLDLLLTDVDEGLRGEPSLREAAARWLRKGLPSGGRAVTAVPGVDA